ncbi:MAG: hydantoinase/oxoprolinase family protein [Thermodesulfobacteriota bacterium]
MIIGLDVGGTHTDVVLLSNESGLVNAAKVPTDPANLFHSVLAGLEEVTRGIAPGDINRVVLSTTLTTNAIVQNKLEPVGMVVCSGPGIDPELYRCGAHYHVVSGAIDHRGREIKPVNRDEIKTVANRLLQEGVRIVGVVGKFSPRNPAHELAIRDVLKDSFDRVFLGHQISGNLNFPRRIATAFLNAAVYPIHLKFYEAVRKSLDAKGLTLQIRILKADGGNMKFDASINFPGQTIFSGPAASVMGSIAFAPEKEDSLVMDIGGTTTDMAILVNRVPLLDPLGIEINNYKTLIRSIDTFSVGLGGDSAVTYSDGRFIIGPERLGPAMAYGGPAPTPTDALFILGRMNGGDRERAAKGIEPLAQALGLTVEAAAAEIFDSACRSLLSKAQDMIFRVNSHPVYTVNELLDGYKVTPKKILVLGGPAPYFAEQFRQVCDYEIEVVPRWSVANAIGAALARTTCEVVLFADTEQAIATAPNENFSRQIDPSFDGQSAVKIALELLREKAIGRGANPDYLEMEVLENQQFNMVRGFSTTGKNIRVKVQVKPGLIHGYDRLLEKIAAGL